MKSININDIINGEIVKHGYSCKPYGMNCLINFYINKILFYQLNWIIGGRKLKSKENLKYANYHLSFHRYSPKRLIKEFSLNKLNEFNPYQPFNVGVSIQNRKSYHKLELLPPPDFISNSNGELVEILRISHE